MIEELCDRIWAHDEFHRDYGAIQEAYLKRRLVDAVESVDIGVGATTRLLQSAIAFATADDPKYRDVAYRIATAAAELNTDQYRGSLYALLIVLGRIGNFPALEFAERRYDVSENSLPIRALYDSTSKSESNTVRLAGRDLRLTNFQTELWRSLVAGESVGISAPTSAGKSFVMQQYVRRQLATGTVSKVGFLVPSRALINQVSQDVSEWLGTIEGIELVTTPIPPEYDLPAKAVFVVTQERMQLLQMSHPNLAFEVLVVDEAQGLGDGARGVVLSSVIEEAKRRNDSVQLMFAGPNLEDPSSLGAVFGIVPRAIKTLEATVSQNLIFLDTVKGKPKAVDISVLNEGERRHLGRLEAEQALRGYTAKLVNLALRFGGTGQTLVYAKGTKDCENIAFQLSDQDDLPVTKERAELSEFIKDAVHPKYTLSGTVLKGVGFHYGRLPSLVRKTVEDAFAEGVLSTLVTTSTLLQGVNLPAQNLFLCQPQRGPSQPINSIDFWNIYLIDYDEWESHPIEGERQKSVTPSIQDHIVHRTGELVEYINDVERAPQRNQDDEFENTFVKLVRDGLRGNLETTLERVGLQENREPIVSAIEAVIARSNLAPSTIDSSPTVSVHRQNRLYTRIRQDLEKRGADYVVPRHPLDGDAFASYARAIKRLHDTVLGYAHSDQSHRYFAVVIIKWISGDPLPAIIDEKFEYQNRTANPSLASVIRETLKEIETDLRHKYVKLFSCYNSILEQVLRDVSEEDAIASIPPLPTYLEVGASSGTMISFMGLGLSRYTSGKLKGIARRSDMDQAEARRWIRSQDIDALDIPAASIKEIHRMLG
jgi:hypothetical protein